MKSPFDLWLEKDGDNLGYDDDDRPAFEAGIAALAKTLSLDAGTCRYCGEPIWKATDNKTSRKIPISRDGSRHSASTRD